MNNRREIDVGRGRESFFRVGRATFLCMAGRLFGRHEKKTPDPLGLADRKQLGGYPACMPLLLNRRCVLPC